MTAPARHGRRPTIAEIASRSGVSSGAVSYALNGRPGVSDETRARIIAIAEEIGWVPSNAARALRGGAASAIGLVIAREPSDLGVEPFFMAFIAGIEQVLSEHGFALMLQVTARKEQELATYRNWWSARRVDGIILTDLKVDDERLALLAGIGLPAVVVGDPAYANGATTVWSDDAHAAQAAVERLSRLGHTRIAHVAGPAQFAHTRVRSEAMRRECHERGMAMLGEINTDSSLAAGTQACEDLLSLPEPPTAIVFDNDVTALAGLRVARSAGLRVPDDLSILAWDDSPLCEISEPPLSALRRDVPSYGASAATVLLHLIQHGEAVSVRADSAQLVERGSLAQARP